MTTTLQTIQSKIINLPNRPPCMLAQDLAEIYETTTRRINESVRRNPNKFPDEFCFRMTDAEWNELCERSQSAIFRNANYAPRGFTREGANMLATILKTPVAVQRSIQIIRAFTRLEEVLHAQRQPAPAPVETAPPLSDGQIVISKDRLLAMQQETITLQQEMIALLKAERARVAPRTHTRITPEEEQTILTMTAAGRKVREIADALNRPAPSIANVLRRHQ